MSYQLNTGIVQILFNIIGGAIVVGLIEVGRLIFRYLKRWKFKRFFGKDIINADTYIVHAELGLPEVFDRNGELVPYPYIKPGAEVLGSIF